MDMDIDEDTPGNHPYVLKENMDSLLSNSEVGVDKLALVDNDLEGDFSFWYDPSESIEQQMDAAGINTEKIDGMVMKAEPYDEGFLEKNYFKEDDEELITKDEILQKVADLKPEFVIKEEIKSEENNDNLLLVSKVELILPCNPGNDPYHYCPKCSFKCTMPDCGFITKSKNVFETHKKFVEHKKLPRRKLSKQIDYSAILRCTYCAFTTTRKDLLHRHIRGCEKIIVKQNRMINSKCQECGFLLNKNAKTCKKCGWRIEDKEKQFKPTNNKKDKALNDNVDDDDIPVEQVKTDVSLKPSKSLKCTFCSFETSAKDILAAHVLKDCKSVLELACSTKNEDLEKDDGDEPAIRTTDSCGTTVKSSTHNPNKPSPTLWSCEFCPYKTHKLQTLIEHLKHECKLFVLTCCKSPGSYSCNMCSYMINNKSELIRHLLNKCAIVKKNGAPKLPLEIPQKDGIFMEYFSNRCKFCEYVNDRTEAVIQHALNECPNTKKVARTSAYDELSRCDVCCFETKSFQELIKHKLEKSHNFTCRYCPFKSKTKWPLKAHLWKHEHTGKCEMCGLKFKTLNDYNNHKKDHKTIEEPPSQPKPKCQMISCKNCNFSTSNYQFMKAHKEHCKEIDLIGENEYVRTSSLNILNSCKICETKRSNKGAMVKHYAADHSSIFRCVTYKCNYCLYTTVAVSDFHRHLLSEHKNKGLFYECPICFEVTNKSVEYRWHYLQHFTK